LYNFQSLILETLINTLTPWQAYTTIVHKRSCYCPPFLHSTSLH